MWRGFVVSGRPVRSSGVTHAQCNGVAARAAAADVGGRGAALAAAETLAGRRVLLVGVGTSWHAAQHGAWMLREAGVRAEAAHAADLAPYDVPVDSDDGVVVLSHTGGTGYSMQIRARAREAGAATVHISAIGKGGDVETVAPEDSYAYTSSPPARCARRADRDGARRPARPARRGPRSGGRGPGTPGPLIDWPERPVELIGAGPNAWTAQEGALKIREASYTAAEGLSE